LRLPWASGGVVRSGLIDGLERIASLKDQARDVDVRPSSEGYKDLAIALDLQRALVVAEATLLGAQLRRESRGAHARSDFPALDPALTQFRHRDENSYINFTMLAGA
jgi:succinate dehydrogenase / fumarate reductase flavoprotein subunit